MKRKFLKIAAAALSFTMVMSSAAFADDETTTISTVELTGYTTDAAFATSFDVYSPTLSVTVPTNLDIQVNPVYSTDTDYAIDTYKVASKDMVIQNYSYDEDTSTGIPVLATIKATMTPASGVVTYYNGFTSNDNSVAKEISLDIVEGSTTDGSTVTYGSGTEDPTTATVTAQGSRLQIPVEGSTDGTIAAYGAFAIAGDANVNADWTSSDLSTSVTFSLKASSSEGSLAPTVTAITSDLTSDVTFDINDTTDSSTDTVTYGLDGATVTGVVLHNNNTTNGYGDYDIVTLEPDSISAASADGTTTVTINKDSVSLAYIGANYSDAQDLAISLSDGRVIVTTLTVSA